MKIHIRLRLKRFFYRNFKLIIFSVIPFILFWNLFLFILEITFYRVTEKDISFNQNIMKQHFERASRHPYRFNDISPSKKTNNSYRIIVLGDSFIYGDGLPLNEIWSRKLETKIKNKYENVEVLHWGSCGWGTLDQLSFLKSNFSDKKSICDADLLIIGFVLNDTDMKEIPCHWFELEKHFPYFTKFPAFTLHFNGKINNFLSQYSFLETGYDAWLRKLYSEPNLEKYQQVLKQLETFLNRKNTPFLVVITPDALGHKEKKRIKLITSIFDQLNIDYLNFFEELKMEIASSSKPLRANLANRHPGPAFTDGYAKLTFQFLEKNKYFASLTGISRQDSSRSLET